MEVSGGNMTKISHEQRVKLAVTRANNRLREKMPLFSDVCKSTYEEQEKRLAALDEASKKYLDRIKDFERQQQEKAEEFELEAFSIFPKDAEKYKRHMILLIPDIYSLSRSEYLLDSWRQFWLKKGVKK